MAARCGIFVGRIHGFEEAITAACSSALACSETIAFQGPETAVQRSARVTACVDRVALRVAAVNKEATLSAYTTSSGSPGVVWRGAAARATQAIFIIHREIPCSCWESICAPGAMPHLSRGDLQTPGAKNARAGATGRKDLCSKSEHTR
jgi:hypothetical protein